MIYTKNYFILLITNVINIVNSVNIFCKLLLYSIMLLYSIQYHIILLLIYAEHFSISSWFVCNCCNIVNAEKLRTSRTFAIESRKFIMFPNINSYLDIEKSIIREGYLFYLSINYLNLKMYKFLKSNDLRLNLIQKDDDG